MNVSSAMRACRRLLPAAMIVVAALLALRRLDDFDTWWHLASGRWIVENGAVPHTDTLSYTVPDHPWINLQWLYDVVLYALFRVGGDDLLVLASAACLTAAVVLMVRNLRLWVGDVTVALVTLCTLLVVEERFFIRPEMISFLLLEAQLLLLMTARGNDGRHLWLLVPLMLVWVNSHSLFIIGLFCLGCTVAGALAARVPLVPAAWREASAWQPLAFRRLLVAAGAATVVMVLNPYLLEGLLFPFKLMSRIDGSNTAFRAIGEFRRPFSGYFTTFSITAYQLFFFAGIAVTTAAGLVTALSRRRPRPGLPGFDLGLLAIFVGLTYVSVLARRNIGIFAFGAAPIVGVFLAVVGTAVAAPLRRSATRAADAAAPVLLACSMLLAYAIVSNGYYASSGVTREFGLGTLEMNFPIHAAAFAGEAELPPQLYNDLTAGGYLTWESGVAGGVFIDGRLEVYDTEFFSEYLSALSNPNAWLEQANAFGVNTVLLFHRWGNRHRLIRALKRDPGWSLVYHDEVAIIFVRARGNDEAIRRARALYPAWREKTLARLDAPDSRWQAPIGLVYARMSYAALMSSIDATDESLRLYDQLLELDLNRNHEIVVRTRLGILRARLGERGQARRHLERAIELDPDNGRVRQMLSDLGA